MTDNKTSRGIALSARMVIGAVVVAASAALVAAATVVPLPQISTPVPRVTLQPAAADATLVCSGSALVSGRDATNAQALSVAGSFATTAVSSDGVVATDIPVTGVEGATAHVITAAPIDGVRAVVGGASAVSIASDDVAGFAASACRPAVSEGWFVGIDARTGSSGVLVLTNPGSVTASVSLTAYGVAGPAASSQKLVIPGGTASAIAVASLTGGDGAPVLRLQSDGAPVQASLQSAAVRGLLPVGIDVQDVVATPSTVQIIPGAAVVVPGAATALRLMATESSATAQVTVSDASGATVSSFTADLVGGIPFEAPLADLPAGTYTVTATASTPIVAALWQASGAAEGDDFAWYPAVPEIRSIAAFGVAEGAPASLTVVNNADTDASVLVAGNGKDRTLNVPAGSSVSLSVRAGRVVTIDPQGNAVYASVTYATGTQTAGVGVWPADADASAVTITR